MFMPRLIFKLQRPLASNVSDPPWQAYTQTRRHVFIIPDKKVPADVRAAMGNDPKGYFEGEIILGELRLHRRVDDQEW